MSKFNLRGIVTFSWKCTLVLLACSAGRPNAAKAQQPLATVHQSQAARGAGGAKTYVALRYAQQDQGRESQDKILHRVRMLLTSTPDEQAALTEFLEAQRTPTSGEYHRWLTPLQFAHRFGAAQVSIERVTAWLEAHGMTEIEVSSGHRSITFAGSVSNLSSAFQTEIHSYKVDGVLHFSNTIEATVPSELSDGVSGVVGLNDFQPRSQAVRVMPEYAQNGGENLMGPDDLATMYDLHQFYSQNIDGSGITIAIPGDAQVLLSDYQSYRSTFGLSPNDYQVVEVPNMQTNVAPAGSDASLEPTLDLEFAGALAHNATILYIQGSNVVEDTQYVIDNQLAQIISASFGECETATSYDHIFYQQMAQQANAEGITWAAASGDLGPANCDWLPEPKATQGLSVLLPASVPEVTAVGGTRVQYASGAPYWSATNNADQGNVLEYIPEAVWNDTSNAESGGGGWTDAPVAAGGGFSAYFPLPGYQAGFAPAGIVNRMTPDISLNASNGLAPDALVFNGNFTAVGGTSASTPTFAGLLAVVEQYLIANKQLSAPGLGNVNPTIYNMYQSVPTAFHDITAGDNYVPCVVGTPDCATGTMGYPATVGYDMASGLGSLDAFFLASNWQDNEASSSTTTLSVNDTSQTAGQNVTFTTQTSASGGNPQNGVITLTYSNPTNQLYANSMSQSNLPGPFPATGVVDSTGTATIATSLLPAGVNTVTANYGGSTTVNSSISNSVTVTINALPTTVTVNVPTTSAAIGEPVSFTATVTTPSGGSPILSTTLPGNTGWVNFFDQSGGVYSSAHLLASNTVSFTTPPLLAGTNQFTVAFGGTAYTSGSQCVFTITGTSTPATLTHLTATPTVVALGNPVTLMARVSEYASSVPLTGTVTFQDGKATLGSSPLTASGTASLTTAALSLGSHSISAIYAGNFSGSTSETLIVQVVPAPAFSSTTSMTASASQVTAGAVVTLTATVSETGTTTIPMGTVQFCDATAAFCTDSHLLGTAQVTPAGTAILRLVPGVGSHTYLARYVGTSAVAGSASAALPVNVGGPASSATTLQSSGSAGDYSLSATVTGFGPTTPTGSISFLDTTAGNSLLDTATLSADIPDFQMSTNSSVGLYPDGIVSGDFNGDGIPDLAVANLVGQSVTILLGDGKGGFASFGSGISIAGDPMSIAAGDFNSDGNLDLAVVNATEDTVGIYLGDGKGNFTLASSAWPGAFPRQIIAADVNGDGIPDLIVLDNGQNIATVNVLLGDGTGNFTPVSPALQVTSDSYYMAVADFNGDGKPDLAIAECFSDLVAIYFGNGDGTFTPGPTLPTVSFVDAIAAGDLNGDSVTDLAVTNANGQVSVFLGNGDGTFTTAPAPTAGVVAGLISIGDMNGDGIPDLVVADTTSTVAVLLGNGDGTFASSYNSATGTSPGAIVLADLNGDGIPDLALTDPLNDVLNLYLTRQSATAAASGISPYGAGTHQIEASYQGDNNFASSISPAVSLTAESTITPAVVVTPGSSSITTFQSLTVSVSISGGNGNPAPTGTVTLSSGNYSQQQTLVNGAYLFTVPAGSLAIGNDTLTASYVPDSNSAAEYNSATGMSLSPVTVTAATPAVTVTPGSTGITTAQALSVTVGVSGGTGNPTPTGSVTLSGGSYTSAATALIGGSSTINIPANTLAVGSYTFMASYTPDSSSSSEYGSALGTASTAVTVIAAPTFTDSNSGTITVTQGATTGNTSTITVTPANGFTGTVSLRCLVTTTPTSPTDPVTCSIPSPVSISGTTAQTATLTADSTSTTTTGSYAITVTAQSASITQTTVVNVTVNEAYLLSAGTPSPSSVSPGGSTSVAITAQSDPTYSGKVTFTCQLASSPTGANDLPGCALSGSITYANGTPSPTSVTATVNTMAASSTELVYPRPANGKGWLRTGGGAVLGVLIFFWIPARQRNLRSLLGLLVLMTALGSLSACGGSGGAGGGGGSGNPGTTAGSYTFKVTGTGNDANSTSASTTFTVSVN